MNKIFNKYTDRQSDWQTIHIHIYYIDTNKTVIFPYIYKKTFGKMATLCQLPSFHPYFLYFHVLNVCIFIVLVCIYGCISSCSFLLKMAPMSFIKTFGKLSSNICLRLSHIKILPTPKERTNKKKTSPTDIKKTSTTTTNRRNEKYIITLVSQVWNVSFLLLYVLFFASFCAFTTTTFLPWMLSACMSFFIFQILTQDG